MNTALATAFLINYGLVFAIGYVVGLRHGKARAEQHEHDLAILHNRPLHLDAPPPAGDA